MGAEGNPNRFRIVGEVLDEDKLADDKEINILKPALHLFQIYVMFYFAEYEKIVDIIEANEDGYFEKSIPGISMLMVNAFQSAIACIHMARKTGKPKYKKLALKFKAKFDSWVKKGVSAEKKSRLWLPKNNELTSTAPVESQCAPLSSSRGCRVAFVVAEEEA